MFERFTERARKVVVLAQDEVSRFGHDYLGTEHILLGLVKEGEGVAARALYSLNVTLGEVREQVESIVGYGDRTGRQVPFTPYAKKVLELALREAMQLDHNYIGTEHILLGLLGESEGVAARVLSNLDVHPDRVRREVVRRLGEEPKVDSLDETELAMEQEEAGGPTLFRGRIASIPVDARAGGRSRKMLVDVDYEYAARDADESSEVPDHEGLLEQVAQCFEEREYRSVEECILEVGRLVLDRFPAVHEVEISAVRERFFERRTASGITVSRTFRR